MIFSKKQILKSVVVAFVGALLGGCLGGEPPKPFDPTKDLKEQTDSFIDTKYEDELEGVKKVTITACNVMFAQKTSASASTSNGLFHSQRGQRSEAKVSVIYYVEGLSDSAMQTITDKVCTQAENKLVSEGYEVVPYSTMKKNDSFQSMMKAGSEAPYEYKVGPATYKVFTRNGASVFDRRYIGTASGLFQAFSAVGGDSAAQHETLALDKEKVSGVQVNVLIDFAALQSSGDGNQLFGRSDSASVNSKVELSVSGDIIFLPLEKIDCYKGISGDRQCSIGNDKPKYFSARPVNVTDNFYEKISETTTTGDKLTSGLTSTLAFFGVGKSHDIERYTVQVNPTKFENVSDKAIKGFMDMAFYKIKVSD